MERKCVLNSLSKEEKRAVIRYEWTREESGAEIHKRLVEVYGVRSDIEANGAEIVPQN